jgi:hypothetical protein
MNSSDLDLVNSFPVSADRDGSTALNRVAGSDERSAVFPLPMAPKTLRHKMLPSAIMRNIGGLNRSEGGLDGLLPAGREEGYTETFPYTQ